MIKFFVIVAKKNHVVRLVSNFYFEIQPLAKFMEFKE